MIKLFKLSGGAFPSMERYFCRIEKEKLKYSETIETESGYKQIEKKAIVDKKVYNKINELVKDWNNEYYLYNIRDGWSWHMYILYNDGTKKEVKCHGTYPDNFTELISILESIIND